VLHHRLPVATRRRAMMRRAVCLAATVLASCTFTGLGRYDITPCNATKTPTSLDDDPCNALDTPAPGPCQAYQCDVASGRCVLAYDREGDPSVACGGHDCDDHDAGRSSHGTDTCDGVDNDCNGVGDEGLVAVLGNKSVLAGAFTDATLATANGKDMLGAAIVT